MSSPIVSDSESEEPFEQDLLSKQKFKRVFRQRKRLNDNTYIRSTGLLADSLSHTINNLMAGLITCTSEDETEAETNILERAHPMQEHHEIDDLQSLVEHPSPGKSQQQNSEDNVLSPTPVSREMMDLATWTDYTTQRSGRTRDLPFYKKHIYVIDCVEYNMGISRERAIEIVKENPEFIDMFRNETLERFLKGKGNSKSKSERPKDKNGREKGTLPEIAIPNIEDIPGNESYADTNDESSWETSSSEEESEDQMEPSHSEIQEIGAKVKGRSYNNIKQLARGSHLPNSFFSLNKTLVGPSHPTKRKIIEGRVGLAKKKKRAENGIGFVDEPWRNDFLVSENEAKIIDDTNDEIELPTEIRKLDENITSTSDLDDDELSMFHDNNSERGIFFKADNGAEEIDLSASEDPGSGIRHMLAGRNIHKRNKSSSTRVIRKRKAASTTSVKSFKRNPLGSTKKRYTDDPRTLKSGFISLGPSLTVRALKVDKRSILNLYNEDLSIQTGLKHIHSDEGENESKTAVRFGQVKSKTLREPLKKKKKKVREKAHLFSPSPYVVLPRSAHISTTVYEGLSDKFALVKKQIRQKESAVLNEIDTPVHDLRIYDQDPSALKGRFVNSEAYKILFQNLKKPYAKEVKVTLGQFNIMLSRLNQNIVEKLSDLFDSLLKPGLINSSTPDLLISSLIAVIGFCTGLDSSQARSLITIIDNFKFKLEAAIRRKGKIWDVEFYFFGFCAMLYYCCAKIFQDNSLRLFDYESKSNEINTLFFELIPILDTGMLAQKLKGKLFFSEAISMMFLCSGPDAWSAIEKSDIDDMMFLKELCALYPPQSNLWRKVGNIIRLHSTPELHLEKLRIDFKIINELISVIGWEPDQDILSLMCDSLKKNKFQNFPNEASNPGIIGSDIPLDATAVNTYLTILINFSEKHGKISGRLLEKLIPVSKVSNIDVVSFCNRMNLLLCLSRVSKKSLESRITEVISSCDFESKVFVQNAFNVISYMVKVNNENNIVSQLESLRYLLTMVVKKNFLSHWLAFLKSVRFDKLMAKTQKNLLSVVSNFQNSKPVIDSCTEIIELFITNMSSADSNFIKINFGSINPNLYPKVWCHIMGSLVSNDLENWSRLIRFINFNDEPLFYTYILKHSGAKIYVLENEGFISILIKNAVKSNYSSSLNALMREIAKNDFKFASLRNLLIQTHRLQITQNIISSILKNASMAAKSRYLSLCINIMKHELDTSAMGNNFYINYSRKIVNFINLFGYEYVNSSAAFEELCSKFNITRNISNAEVSRLVNSNGDINECLKFIQIQLIQSFNLKLPQNASFSSKFVPLLINHTAKKISCLNDQMKDSKFYTLCASLSVNVQLLSSFSTTNWIFIYELIETLYKIIIAERNFSKVDFFAILTTLKTFPYILTYRNSVMTTRSSYHSNDYQVKLETMTLIKIYKIFQELYKCLSGTNELPIFIDLVDIFTSRRILDHLDYFHIEFSQSNFLMKPPDFMKNLILSANITNSMQFNRLKLSDMKNDLEDAFYQFTRLVVEDYQMNDLEEGYLSDW